MKTQRTGTDRLFQEACMLTLKLVKAVWSLTYRMPYVPKLYNHPGKRFYFCVFTVNISAWSTFNSIIPTGTPCNIFIISILLYLSSSIWSHVTLCIISLIVQIPRPQDWHGIHRSPLKVPLKRVCEDGPEISRTCCSLFSHLNPTSPVCRCSENRGKKRSPPELLCSKPGNSEVNGWWFRLPVLSAAACSSVVFWY